MWKLARWSGFDPTPAGRTEYYANRVDGELIAPPLAL
jgi:hypothetical protein